MQEPKEGYRSSVPKHRIWRGRVSSQDEASREKPRPGLKSLEL